MREIFVMETEAYQGPLDTLLDLIESRKMSISDISLAKVCDAYLSYVEKLPALPLSETSQFILVSSTLLLIKSRTLLPTIEISDDERESVVELELRLARLKIIRRARDLLRSKFGGDALRLIAGNAERPIIFAPVGISRDALKTHIANVTKRLPKADMLGTARVEPIVRLEDVVHSLKTRLSQAMTLRWSELSRGKDKYSAILHFLAILEMIRHGNMSATQNTLFGDMKLETLETSTPSYG